MLLERLLECCQGERLRIPDNDEEDDDDDGPVVGATDD